MTDISVVMACRNAEETLEETLESIGRQQWDRPWEVVFADNGSTDESAAIFDRFADRHPGIPMRRVDASAVQGKARALNRVVPMARGRAILLADSDDVMAPGWLAAMGAALDEADLVAAASEFQKLNAPWVLEYRLPDPATRSRNQETYHFFYQNIPFVSGHCMGFTRKLFDELGGFDVDYSVGDDVDFSGAKSAYFNSSFSATCPGGPHTVKWGFDGNNLGSATFYDQFTAQFTYKLPAGGHVFHVDAGGCGQERVKFNIG
jgi:glycosyltransferase involved in cell wall biosynthesis